MLATWLIRLSVSLFYCEVAFWQLFLLNEYEWMNEWMNERCSGRRPHYPFEQLRTSVVTRMLFLWCHPYRPNDDEFYYYLLLYEFDQHNIFTKGEGQCPPPRDKRIQPMTASGSAYVSSSYKNHERCPCWWQCPCSVTNRRVEPYKECFTAKRLPNGNSWIFTAEPFISWKNVTYFNLYDSETEKKTASLQAGGA